MALGDEVATRPSARLALIGAALGGITLAAFTRIGGKSGAPAPAAPPEGQGGPFAADIARLTSLGIIAPSVDGAFMEEQTVTREDMAVYAYRLAGSPERKDSGLEPYRDVRQSSRAYKEIMWLRGQGASYGYFDATFRPTDTVTRAGALVILARLLRAPLAQHASPTQSSVAPAGFADVPEDHWAAGEIEWARRAGLITPLLLGSASMGSDGASAPTHPSDLVNPRAPLTKGELAHILSRALDLFEN